MRVILCIFLFFLAAVSFVLAQSPQEVNAIELLAELYNDCDKRNKRCFGDSDVCLQYKNCTFAISIAENRTTFKIITVNGCYEQGKPSSRDFYVGVGMNTVDSEVLPDI
ncbi:unnamed protein product [Allacma fusca]|uniref:Uncharacterized protein n=1 Tax=Allacma fusca TaxID=39272 RepID=A0A8J2P9R1_9HEXA|nr:unnamed protein product [Allacma fusca]